MAKRSRILVGMSGGVDSSLAAALLCEQGFDVTGVFLKVWSEEEFGSTVTPQGNRDRHPDRHPRGVTEGVTDLPFTGACPWEQDLADARSVADQLGIELIVKSVQRQYWDRVVTNFLASYQAGLTPNPDVLCNSQIKFGLLYEWAVEQGFDAVATGHYARIGNSTQLRMTNDELRINNDESQNDYSRLLTTTYSLLRGVDPAKDQTYFLWQIDRSRLAHMLFPIGHLMKVQVREQAAKRGLATATKKDSQGICFLGPLKVRQWLQTELATKPGDVVSLDGTVIGTHQGTHLYTLGQRRGFTVDRNPPQSPFAKGEAPVFPSLGKEGVGEISGTDRPAYYVVKRDIKRNELVVSPTPPQQRELHASGLNWLTEPPQAGDRIEARIRHGQTPQPAQLVDRTDRHLLLEFTDPQTGIAPGQSVVLSRGDLILGGGIIA